MMTNDTVRDVCAEMYNGAKDTFGNRLPIFDDFADRILAAHESEMKRMHDCCDALEDELDGKDAEIVRLNAALKPVIDFAEECEDMGFMPLCVQMRNAVRDAKRIYKEG